jgi:COMPASS component SPP1
MIHERAQAAAKHPDVDEKAVCGYDNRLAFNEHEFAHWLSTAEGKSAFETGKLGPRTAESKAIGARVFSAQQNANAVVKDVPDELNNICLKSMKSCVRHKGWRIIHGQDYAAMSAGLSKELERLERKAGEIVEDAETREAMREYNKHNTVEVLF